jgi:AcrR family transcriptional regulator
VPRAGLTRERVVEAAADLADEVGLPALTLAAVAQRFEVALPSLYKHVAGLDGLQRDLALLGLRDLTVELSRAAVGRAGPDALRSVATAIRTFARQHPGRYLASVRAPAPGDAEHTAASDEALSILLAVFAGYGIDGGDAVDAIRSLRAAVHGFVTLEAAGGFGQPRSVDGSFRRLIDALDTAYRDWGSV